jgi:PAS domain S-box-containing protein
VIGAVLLAGVVIGRLIYQNSFDVLLEHERVDLADESRLKAEAILEHIGTLRTDVLHLAGLPEVEAIIRSYDVSRSAGGGQERVDPDSGLSLEELRTKLQNKYVELCKQDGGRPYVRVQLIAAKRGGDELVRVERDPATSDFVPRTGAGDEAFDDRAYYKGTALLMPQQVYLDDIQCDADGGAVDCTARVLRAAVPLFDSRHRDAWSAGGAERQSFFGVLAISLDFQEVVRKSLDGPRFRTYLTNEYGEFLVHPQAPREFEFVVKDPSLFAAAPAGAVVAEGVPLYEERSLGEIADELRQAEPIRPRSRTDPSPLTMEERELAQKGVRFSRQFTPDDPADQLYIVRLDLRKPDGAQPAARQQWEQLGRRLKTLDDEESIAAVRELLPGARWTPLSASNTAEGRAALDRAVAELIAEFPAVVQPEPGYQVQGKTFHGHLHRLHFDPLYPRRHLGLLTAFSDEEQRAELRDTALAAMWRVALVVLAVGGAAIWFSVLLTRRLGRVTRAAEAIAQGDMNPDLAFAGGDEIGDLARGFQRMIVEVQNREAEVREREAKLQLIFEAAADGIILVDEDDRITRCNAACGKLFRCAPAELIGESVLELIVQDDQSSVTHSLHCLGSGEQSLVSLEADGRRRTGERIPLEISLSYVEFDGRSLRTFIVRDITERKQAKQVLLKEIDKATSELRQANEDLKIARDKAQELSQAKDAFLASVSHELRNPLNQVFGFCQLLELSELDDSQKEDLAKIRAASSHLLALINDILDYQKIIMGGIHLEPETFEVAQLVEEVRDGVAVQPNENANLFALDCQVNVGAMTADKRRVRQVLLNLVSNAMKFTSRGQVALRVRRQQVDGADWISMTIADTGRGMTAEEQAKLFRPFVKLSAKAGNRTGTGLGLVISQGLCKLMGGRIRVESQPGVGSRFTIELPAHTSGTSGVSVDGADGAASQASGGDEAPATVTYASPPPQAAPPPPVAVFAPGSTDSGFYRRTNRTVLVVDDDPNQREVMERYLTRCGYDVILAADGVEGIQLAQQRRPAAITLDVLMPGLDGWSVLAALKGDDRTRSIPVVITTVVPRDEAVKLRGAASVFCKPIDWESLAGALATYVDGQYDRSVLVVDDDPELRHVIRRLLERDNWTVIEAENGAEAIDLLSTVRPAVILLDLLMPVMDGFEFIGEYARHEEWLSIPIIVHTAKDLSSDEMGRLKGTVVRLLRKSESVQASIADELRQLLFGTVHS